MIDVRNGDRMLKRWREARERRAEILRDLRLNGWRSLRDGVAQVQRVISQAPSKAMASGKQMARKVLSIQRAAGLNEKLVQRSALSVVIDREPRHQSAGHTAWVAGYAAEVRERVPGILPDASKPREWFEVNPRDPDKEDKELEA